MFHMGVAEPLATPGGKSRYTGPVQSTAQNHTSLKVFTLAQP